MFEGQGCVEMESGSAGSGNGMSKMVSESTNDLDSGGNDRDDYGSVSVRAIGKANRF